MRIQRQTCQPSGRHCDRNGANGSLLTLELLLLALGFQLLLTIQPGAAYCDRTFVSSSGEFDDATPAPERKFVAPNGVKAKLYAIYENEQGKLAASKNLTLALQQQRNRTSSKLSQGAASNRGKAAFHCLYKFIAREDERVVVSFNSFKLRGEEPECNHEYVDIYLGLKSADDFEATIGRQEPPSGRFCTSVVPNKVVSLHNTLLFSIYSDLEPPADGRPLFTGVYEFIKSRPGEQNMGPPEKGTLCTHTIYSSAKREGELQSVTYPGVYVKNLRCSYKLIGEPNQRIRLEFLDLDLYSGGSHCPFDSIKVFDGLKETDPLIQTICGSHRSLIVFSTHENLLITFSTLQREVEIQDRGFSAYFEFSDKFYSPDFIQGPNGRHIRGSECDQRIVSSKGSRGVIVSPEQKRRDQPTGAICRYFFESLQSSHEYEKVLLKFTEFDLKRPGDQAQQSTTTTTATTTTTTTTASTLAPFPVPINQTLAQANSTDPSSAGANGTSADQCPDNYVRIYTSEQKPDQKQDPNDYDYVFCGNELPTNIESDAASMLMEYNSGTIGGYFKAEYNFIDDYRISGLQASTSGCNYIYRSDLLRSGTFSSPRHPSWYINDVNCSYTLLTRKDEALLLQFTTLTMDHSYDEKLVVGMNEFCASEDALEIDEITPDATNDTKALDQFQIGTYCGVTRPGPILSFRPVQVHFRTNKEKSNYGFNAIYHFHSVSELRTNEFVSNCGGQVHATHWQRSGTFSSPPTYRPMTYEKRNHVCAWNITARPAHRIALDFYRFELEGHMFVRGCQTASVRLEMGKSQPKELCGSIAFPPVNTSLHQFVSEGEWLAVSFISTKLASGSHGFNATWTEIKR